MAIAQSGQEVLTAAQAGDGGALSVVRSAAEALGATIAWLINVLDPEAVIIGGGPPGKTSVSPLAIPTQLWLTMVTPRSSVS